MPARRPLLLSIVFLASLLLAVSGFYRSGNSLCWIVGSGDSAMLRQIQFAPYYWHSNLLRSGRIESVSVVPAPENPDRRALQVASGRMILLYDFAHDGWIDDIDAFAEEVAAVAAGERRFSCRIRAWTGVFALALALGLVAAVALAGLAGRRMLRRREG